MLALTLRGIAARKLRTALTAFAIVLGIALVSGTYLLTDTIDSTFDTIFQTANQGVDVVVTPKRLFGTDENSAPAPLKQSVVDEIRQVPGVALAAGSIFDAGLIYDKDDDPLITTGAPMFIADVSPERFSPFNYAEGHAPRTAREVALDQTHVDKAGFELGDTVRLSGKGPQESFRLVGVTQFGDQASLGGAAIALVTTPVAQRLLDLPDQFNTIQVAAQAGTAPRNLSADIREALPADAYTVRTGSEQARSDARDIQDQLGFLRTFLFVFAGISLFVGAFLIVNTFSITVAQRVREFALLRMIGANRRQILRAVIGEAFLLGLVASAVGFLLGFGLAPGLKALFKAFGADLPASGIVFEPRTLIVSILLGTVITLVAAIGPAVRATRVPPIAALQDASSLPRGRAARWRTPIAGVIAGIGVALLCLGLFGSSSGGSAAALVGAGAGVVFIGVGLLAFLIVRPLAAAVGLPLERLRGVSGRLARENATRNPRRTASTSAALMIGVALVAFVTIFAAGLKASIDGQVESGLKGQMIVESKIFGLALPASATRAVADQPGVQTVSGIRFSNSRVAGVGKTPVTGVDPQTIDRVFNLDWTDGSPATIRALGPREVLLAKDWAKDHDKQVGDTIALTTPTGAQLQLRATGIYDDKANLFADLTVTNLLMAPAFNVTGNAFLMVGTTPGADVDAVKDATARSVKAQYPSLKVLTKQGFIDEQNGQVTQLLIFFYVLLALTIVISLFGIVNTLVLAIHERTRELGMLRAIGTSRRQVKQLVRYESVITAMIGSVLGVVLGGIFAVLVTIPLKSEGFTISIPILQLVILLVVAAIFGVIAAIWPARRAARLDVLSALAYE
ncbi:MAG TPA: FtsX-like permease family protein [Conexibacter sp.]|jgi:putative ABC transport system permease protein|nr:FtsX-like permease family protein [Conexibacter sp.]